MVKCAGGFFVTLFLMIVLFAQSVFAQTFDPLSASDLYPTGGETSNSYESVNPVCASCPSALQTETFRVTAVDDGTSNIDNAYFEWVVFGGEIISNAGTEISRVSSVVGANTRQYLRAQGIDAGESWITVQMDPHLPVTVWVAVRQSNEFNCTNGLWSVHLIRADDVDPVITIADANTWTSSLVVIDDDNSYDLTLSAFEDNVHSAVDPVSSASTVNVDPIPSDNCNIDATSSTVVESGGTFDGNYGYGTHTFTSTAYDCQGNNVTVVQNLYIYDAAGFSLSVPADVVYPDNVCSPAFEDNIGDVVITAPAGWSERSRRSELSDYTEIDACHRIRTRTYTVTMVHANNHNTYDITATRTYTYPFDETSPSLTTKPYSVDLDASGNATIVAADIIDQLSDGCTATNDIQLSLSQNSFDCSHLGDDNTVTLTVADLCGNPTTQTATVTVNDLISPVITCQANASVVADPGSCLASLLLADPVTSDNCTVDSVYWVMTGARTDASPKTAKQQFVGTYSFPIGTTRVAYTVKDQSGNSASCFFDITVTDNQIPVVEAPGMPANLAHIAWEQRNYTFTVPTITDNCNVASYTMSVNGGAPVDLLTSMGTDYLVNLNSEAPGDVNGNGVGVNNTVVFTYSDGVNPVQTYTWTIHVDFRPRVLTTAVVDPTCIGSSNGSIQLPAVTPIAGHEIEVRNNVIVEYSYDNSTFIQAAGLLLINLSAGNYYFRVSTMVGTVRSFSEVLTVTLLDPPLITLTDPASAITNETCQDDNLGAINLTVTYLDADSNPDPFRPYTMVWTKDGIPISPAPADPYNLTGLDSSVYHLRVTDNIGCFVEQTYVVSVNNNELPTITDAPGITVPDPGGLADGGVTENVDPASCSFLVPDNRFDPTAIDGTVNPCPVTLTHNYTGMPGYSWNNTNTLSGAHFPVDTTFVTWTATDASNNTVQRTYSIIVTDNEAPQITVSSNVQFPFCRATRHLPFPAVSDNCGIDSVKCNLTGDINWYPNISGGLETETYTVFSFDSTASTPVTWTVYDRNGLSTPATYNVTFTTPIDTIPSFQVDDVQCEGLTNGHITLDFVGGTPNFYITVGSVFTEPAGAGRHYDVQNLQPYPYTITIVDADNCEREFEVTVGEPDPILAPFTSLNNDCFEDYNGVLDLTVQGGNGGYNYSWSDPTYPYADGHPWLSPPDLTLPATEDQAGLPTGRYILTVIDARLCEESFTYDILSNDVTPPVYTSPGALVTRNSDADICTYTVDGTEFDPSGVSDDNDCDWLVWHNIRPAADTASLAGLVFNQGTTPVIWKVYDRSGNGTTFTVNYRVDDSQFPVFTTPPATVNGYVLLNQCGYWFNASDSSMVVTDNCPWPANYISHRRSDNSLLPLTAPFEVKYPDADTVFWTLRDGAGNTVYATQLVYIRDTIDPVISNCTAPLNVYLRANPANPNYTLPVTRYENDISDNCGELDTIYADRVDDPSSRTFTCSDVGQVRSVNINAIDVWGNLSTCERQVNVLDTIRPLVGTTPRTIYLSPSSATLTPSILNNGSLDNCDPTGLNLYYRLVHNGTEQTDSTFDCSQIGIHPLTLRVYDRDPALFPIDANHRDVIVDVTVADTIAPVATPFGSRPILYINNLGQHTVVPGNLVDTIIDNCDSYANLVLSANPSVVTCDSIGLTSVLLTMNDRWGNDRTVKVGVDVRDTIAPIVVLKNIEVRLGMGVSSDTTLTGDMFDNGSSDNCDNLRFWVIPDTFNCNDLGDNQVDVYVTDGNDTIISEQTVTIITPVTVLDIKLNACNSSAFFSGEVTPVPLDVDEYDWQWWSVPQNNGEPNDNIFCTDASDADIKHGGPSCAPTSIIPEPYFCQPNNNEFYIRLRVKPKNSICWSDSFTYFLNSQQGSTTKMYIENNVDACIGEVDTILITPINGSSAVAWSITGNGTILSSYVATDRDSAWAVVEWTTATTGYSETGYLELSVTYDTGGGSTGKKACNDLYRWYPWIHVAPEPAFVEDYSDLVCPDNEVTYRLSESYVLYDWKGMTAGQIVGGGTPTDSFMVVRWNGLLGASDFLKVIVHNSDYCFDSTWTSTITIEDNDPPVFTSNATNRVMTNQTNRCDTILTGLPIPSAVDSCSGVPNNNVSLTYSIVDNNNVTDTIYKGDPTNYNARRLEVGVWKVTWVVKDAGLNKNDNPFWYTITVNDGQNPVFTTTPNVFYFESNSGTCGYTHGDNSLDLTATDNCMPIDTIWCEVGTNPTHLSTLNGYTFTSSVNVVTWYVRDRSGRQTSHIYTVNISDAEDPNFTFGTFPADGSGINYEGSFAANTRFYIFDESDADSFEVHVPAIITDNCAMGPVLVTLTFPDAATRTYTVPAPSSGSTYEFIGRAPLGRTVIDWTYSDAAGNDLTMSHRVIFASHNGFECGVDETMWEGEHRCNPVIGDFSEGEATPDPPDWFDTLKDFWNALNYTFEYNVVLDDPDGSECRVFRDKQYVALYQINIVGNPTSQMSPDAGCTQVFEYYIDNTGPVIDPAHKYDLVLECGNYLPSDIQDWLDIYAGVVPADITDNCDDGGFLIGSTFDPLNFLGSSCGNDSVTLVPFTVMDSCGNVSNYTANIRLRDTEDPWFTISGVPVTDVLVPTELTISCDEDVPSYTLVAADDCDPTPNPVVYSESNNQTNIGDVCSDNTYDITRTWRATDDCGNDSVWTQVVHVVDNTPPIWDPSYNLTALVRDTTVNCGQIPPSVNIPIEWFIEDCDLNPQRFARDVSNQVADPLDAGHYNYQISRYWSVKDNCNPPLEELQIITVQDTTPPQITAASNPLVQCEGIGVTTAYDAWLLSRGGSVAADLCTPVGQLILSNNDGSVAWSNPCGNSRSKTITFSATDRTGHTATTTGTFTYTDTQAPIVTGAWPASGSLYWGLYDSIAVMPAALTTVNQIENEALIYGNTIQISDGCATDDELNVALDQDTVYFAGCNFNLLRTYTISDDCGNSVNLPVQTFTVRDGIKPIITKALSTLSGCALDPITQITTIAGLALKASDIFDNCVAESPGSYFIANANTRIQYQTVHSIAGTSPWTFGNPDQMVFQEGETSVYYRVTDANNNTSIVYHLYNVTVLRMPVISNITTTEPTGIVGGATNPLRFSTHTYTVSMSQLSNLLPGPAVGQTGWKIFPAGNRTTPYLAGTDYSIALSNVGNDVTATITFDGNLLENVYDLVFVEQDVEGCYATESFTFTLGAPFDVDVDDMADQCPDVDNSILNFGVDVQPDGTGTSTTIQYHIRLVSPANYQNDWNFDYSLVTDETGGGTDAAIQSVTFADNGSGANLGTPPTGNSGTVNVAYNSSGYYTNDITMTVVYEDRHATTQLVTLILTNITGSSGEVDLNVALGTNGVDPTGNDGSNDQNNVRHLMNNLPLPGNISGVE